jgi:DNA-binding transcriptional LysR family regulator
LLVGPRGARDVSALPFVAFRHGAGSRDLLDRHFPERPVAMELGSIAAVLAHVRAGTGISLVSRFALEDGALRQGLRVISDPRTPIRRRLRLVHGHKSALSPATLAFLGLLEKACAERR